MISCFFSDNERHKKMSKIGLVFFAIVYAITLGIARNVPREQQPVKNPKATGNK